MPQRRSKELWEQFKGTCDQIYEKVRGVRAVEQEKFAEVAKVKEALIAEAESLADSTDFVATADKLKALQARWKESGFLPRKQGDELWKRFRGACDRFFERREPLIAARRAEEADNLANKQALIARASAVAEAAPGEGGWGKAIAQIKELQRQWKEVGFVPRRDADAMWTAFRRACDSLFQKRDAARDAEANAHHAELDAVKAEIAEVIGARDSGLGPEGEREVVVRAVAVRAKARELGGLATEVDDMVRHVIAAHGEAVRGTELDPTALRARRAKLIEKVEQQLPKQPPSVAGDLAPVDIATQLKQAMRANAFGDLRFSGRDPFEVVDELRSQWSEIGPVLDDEDRALAETFAAACARVLEAAGTSSRTSEPGGEGGSRRRRSRRDEDRASAPPVAASDAITAPATLPFQPLPAPPLPPTVVAEAPVVAGSAEAEPPRRTSGTSVPPMDELDTAWDMPAEDPTARSEEAPPSASEMAGDSATGGDGIDEPGWD
jgi:hypothetical protein